MANWYDKYISIYGKPFGDVAQEVIEEQKSAWPHFKVKNHWLVLL